MPQLIINLEDKNDMAKAITILSGIGVAAAVIAAANQAQPQTEQAPAPKADEFDDMLGGGGADEEDLLGGGGTSDELDDLIQAVPAVPTVQDMKKAIQAAIDAKGKDQTNTIITAALKKLGVAALSQIPDEKKENFLTVLKSFASKK